MEVFFNYFLAFAFAMAVLGIALVLLDLVVLEPLADRILKSNDSLTVQYRFEHFETSGTGARSGLIKYRILPSDIKNWFVRCFADNDWSSVFEYKTYEFATKDDFTELVSKHKTLGDLRRWQESEGSWIYP